LSVMLMLCNRGFDGTSEPALGEQGCNVARDVMTDRFGTMRGWQSRLWRIDKSFRNCATSNSRFHRHERSEKLMPTPKTCMCRLGNTFEDVGAEVGIEDEFGRPLARLGQCRKEAIAFHSTQQHPAALQSKPPGSLLNSKGASANQVSLATARSD
jgi:hypothetical protein